MLSLRVTVWEAMTIGGTITGLRLGHSQQRVGGEQLGCSVVIWGRGVGGTKQPIMEVTGTSV